MKWTLALLLIPNLIFAQNKYGLTPMKFEAYKESLAVNPQNELVNLEKFIPGIELSIGYATTNNFTGTKIYNLPRAYARKPVAEALKKIQADLKKQGFELKIFDGYRPLFGNRHVL
jgi:D-alanyl-D-alanine dipeptidase